METKTPASLIKPTINTKFHIDFSWWERADRELDVYLRSQMCPEHQVMYSNLDANTMVDHVDEATGEVTQVVGIQHVLITHCSKQPDYLTHPSTLVNAVFRVFLANGNTPLTPEELAQRTGRSPLMILRTLSGPRVYKGIRPYHP